MNSVGRGVNTLRHTVWHLRMSLQGRELDSVILWFPSNSTDSVILWYGRRVKGIAKSFTS